MFHRNLLAFVGVLMLSLTSVGCGGAGAGGLAEQRALWVQKNVSSYRYELRQICFCHDSGVPYEIRVQDGAIVEVKNKTTGEVIDSSHFGAYLTIEGLFNKIQDAVDRDAYKLEVSYDPAYGFPASASIDYIEHAVDEEYGFRASALAPLP